MAETPPEFFIDRSLARKYLANALTEQGLIVHTMASATAKKSPNASLMSSGSLTPEPEAGSSS